MGPGFGEEMFKGLVTGVVILVLVVAAGAFGIGYGCRACDVRPHIEWKRKGGTP